MWSKPSETICPVKCHESHLKRFVSEGGELVVFCRACNRTQQKPRQVKAFLKAVRTHWAARRV